MTRSEADALVGEYDDAVANYRIALRMGRLPPDHSQYRADSIALFHCMNACRERLLDRLCGEEATQPLAGRQP